MRAWSLKHLAADIRFRSTAWGVGKGPDAENQPHRGHVTEALFTLTLDTPVRRWAKVAISVSVSVL